MRFSDVREARRAMLGMPHIKPLADFVCGLRSTFSAEFPDFDPADGGTNASILFLFEKPGPMTSAARSGRQGSGFISRDNDDPTAEATFTFMGQAGIARDEAVIWNVVPGWNGTRAITPSELQSGVKAVEQLLGLLPRSKVIVLVGKKAQRAERLLKQCGRKVFRSPHPSPLVRASQPERWREIPQLWAEAARAITAS
jgi:hypothetical protein